MDDGPDSDAPRRGSDAPGSPPGGTAEETPETVVILNPEAGSADETGELEDRLAAFQGLRLRRTERPGHAQELAAEAAAGGAGTVVAAGGDGTLHEVVNGLEGHLSGVRLGVLPLGTGNDFARTIGIPAAPEEAVEVLRRGVTRDLDVIRVHFGDGGGGDGGQGRRRLLLNMSVGGFAKAVDEALDPETKERWGGLAYARSAARALSDLEAYRTRLVVDDDEVLELDLYLLVVANARYVASGVPAAPEADPGDGRLDVLAFPEMPPGEIAALLPRTLLGRHPDHERVTVRRARRLEVTSTPPMPFNADGETCGETPLTFELLAGALAVIVGAAEDRSGDPP